MPAQGSRLVSRSGPNYLSTAGFDRELLSIWSCGDGDLKLSPIADLDQADCTQEEADGTDWGRYAMGR